MTDVELDAIIDKGELLLSQLRAVSAARSLPLRSVETAQAAITTADAIAAGLRKQIQDTNALRDQVRGVPPSLCPSTRVKMMWKRESSGHYESSCGRGEITRVVRNVARSGNAPKALGMKQVIAWAFHLNNRLVRDYDSLGQAKHEGLKQLEALPAEGFINP